MAESVERNDIAAFAERIRRDPKLREATWNRPQGRPAPLDAAVDYALAVASESGFNFSREELTEYVRAALENAVEVDQPSSEANNITMSVGSLGFGRVLVGLSNPSEVMCQYHAPLAVLSESALQSGPEA